MKVLISSVIRQHPDVLRAALQSWKWQTGKFDADFLFIDDNDDPESADLLREFDAIVMKADPKPEGSRYEVNDNTHDWTVPVFYWLAQQKQKILDYAKANHYDAVWIVDSDLLCSPDTLSSLLNTRKDVVSAVFWTKWTPVAPPLPQVWLAHPYELQGRGIEAHEFLGLLAARGLVRVAGLGACTLIRAGVLDKVGYWPLVEDIAKGPAYQSGMWQGEDRHFCIRAERNRVELWADAWPDVWHCYRPEDRAMIPEYLWQLEHDRIKMPTRVAGESFVYDSTPVVGDLVSFTLEALEEPKLLAHAQHIRGRLGAIKMLPQIEDALRTMRAGDEQILRVRFPGWFPIAEYRHQSRLVRLKLQGCKPNCFHPTLIEPTNAIAEHFLEAA